MTDPQYPSERVQIDGVMYVSPEAARLAGKTVPLDFRPETLRARVDAAMAYNSPIDPETVVLHNNVPYRILDLPHRGLQVQHGYGHWTNDIDRRPQLTRPDGVPWAYTPETCCIAAGPPARPARGVWIDDQHLACPGCGVDFT